MAFAPNWYHASAAVVAVVSVAIAYFVFRAGPRAAPNQYFAFYMALIAGNFACQFFAYAYPAYSVGQRFFLHAGTVFLIWDPAVLVYFSSVFPRRTFFAKRRSALAALAAVPFGLTALFLVDPELNVTPLGWFRLILHAYLGASYAYCLATLALRDPGAQGGARTRQTEALMVGFGIALFPRFGLIVDDLGLVTEGYSWQRIVGRTVAAWSVFLLFLLLSHRATRRDPAGQPRGYRVPWVFRWTVTVLLLFTALWFLGLYIARQVPAYASNEASIFYPFRWIVFAGLVGYFIAKYQVFDIEIRLKRTVAVVAPFLLGLAVFGLAYAGLALLPPAWLADRATANAIFAVGLALVAAFALRETATRLADVLLPRVSSDEAYVRGRKLEVYSAALEAAHAEGRLAATPDRSLEALRARLGIAWDEHEALERLVRRASTGAPRLEDRITSGEPLFGRYRVLRRLDAGGFADIFVARDLRHGRDVVIKRLLHRYREDERILRSFLREAEIAGRLRHPNLVPVHEVLRVAGEAYLVMDYIEGGSLADALKSAGPRPPPDAARLAADVLRGLEAAHREGVFHRDLKPSNLLLARDGRCLITDFGVAHVPNLEDTAGGLSRPGEQPGTPSYMSPEQALGRPVDGRADTYAVGAILYELLVGERLFPADGLGDFELRRRVARGVAAARLGRVPAALRPVLARAVAREPDARYQSPSEMLAALVAAVPAASEARAPPTL